MTFGARLAELRKENGYTTRNEFANKLGIPSTTLRNYETDVREPGHAFLKQVSEMFNVSVDYLLCLTDKKEVSNSFRLRSSEQALIEKYRSLDAQGQRTVSYILDGELSRINTLQGKNTRIAELESALQSRPSLLRIYTYMRKIAATGKVFYFDDIPTSTIEAPFCPDADFIVRVSGDSMEPTYLDGDMVYVHRCQAVETGAIGIFIYNNQCFIKEAGENGLISHNPKYDIIPETSDIICIGKVLGKVELD